MLIAFLLVLFFTLAYAYECNIFVFAIRSCSLVHQVKLMLNASKKSSQAILSNMQQSSSKNK